MDKWMPVLTIALIAGVTMALRFLPFLVFGGKKEMPPYLEYLSSVLPYAMIGMLVVYCLKNLNLTAKPYGIPELLSCGLVAVLHIWKKNTLLSIGAGTLVYMFLVQMVFKTR